MSLRLRSRLRRRHRMGHQTMKRIILALVGIALLNTSILSQSRNTSSKAHRHLGTTQSVAVDIPEFSMAETSLEPDVKMEKLVMSRNKKYDAFTVDGTRLFVTERETKKIFEIKGLPLEWRPFSDLSWVNNQTLMFDRWSQPHYGVHYVVNVKTRKLLVVSPFEGTTVER